MKIDLAQEKKEILKNYRTLLKSYEGKLEKSDKVMIRKAFDLALDAHNEMRRKSGEPYIYHPIAVAHICTNEIGLGTISIVASLLHDTVEDTEVTLGDIDAMFGPKVAKIIDGLTKVSNVFDNSDSLQAENFRKMLLTISDDIRVILIKIADRLHNMRTLDSIRKEKQLKIASETLFLYAPLAHGLGMNAIKSELEDLSLKYTETKVYKEIIAKLEKTKIVRTRFINRFTLPIKKAIAKENLDFKIKVRLKSIYSIWNKMKTKEIDFEEVYDIFAIRIIIKSNEKNEKSDCWRIYSLVTDYYYPNPDRLRDWITTPKANGYESLHTTVMSPTGKWVEVQIRSERMDEIAEKGYASHWQYKQSVGKSSLDDWMARVREVFENPDANAVDFVDSFKMNLLTDEIFVFTPAGHLLKLPRGATALDFAFAIHSQLGVNCLGAKINHQLVPLSHTLKSGDQIEIVTSAKQSPKNDWLDYVVTTKAKSKIKQVLKKKEARFVKAGKKTLERLFRSHKINLNEQNINLLLEYYHIKTTTEFYYNISMGKLQLDDFGNFKIEKGQIKSRSTRKKESLEEIVKTARGKSGQLIVGDGVDTFEYNLSSCCNPIPGDKVFGFITDEEIKIHHTINVKLFISGS